GQKWTELPDHLKSLVMTAIESGNNYRNQWYWGGEAKLRAQGTKLKLTSIPAEEWKAVEDAAKVFWKEISEQGETAAKVVKIFEDYNSIIEKAGPPYVNG